MTTRKVIGKRRKAKQPELRVTPHDVEWNKVASAVTDTPTFIDIIATKAGVPTVIAGVILHRFARQGFVKEGPVNQFSVVK
jgi:hypothetical protein